MCRDGSRVSRRDHFPAQTSIRVGTFLLITLSIMGRIDAHSVRSVLETGGKPSPVLQYQWVPTSVDRDENRRTRWQRQPAKGHALEQCVDMLRSAFGSASSATSSRSLNLDGALPEGPLALLSEDSSTQWHQSASLLFQASKRVGGFLEWFSFFSNSAADNRASHFVDTGLFIYLTPNVQLDVRIGERLGDRIDTLFTGAGLSLRF